MRHGGIAGEDQPRGEEAHPEDGDEEHPFQRIDDVERRRAGRHRHGDDCGDRNAERHVVVDAQHIGPQTCRSRRGRRLTWVWV